MNCLCATTRRAARLLTQRYEEALRPANLTPAQFELLAILSHRPGISQSDLAGELALEQSTLSRNLKPLLTRLLILRTVSPVDRRQTIYSLTSAGHQGLHDAMPLWQTTHRQMERLLGEQWQTTLTSVTRLSASLTPQP